MRRLRFILPLTLLSGLALAAPGSIIMGGAKLLTDRNAAGGKDVLVVKLDRDLNHTGLQATASGAAGVISEAMLTLTPVNAGVAGSTNTTFTVPAGKVLRITSLFWSVRAGAAAFPWSRVVIRTNPSGAVTTSSAAIAVGEAGGNSATIGSTGQGALSFPEGLDIPAGAQIGISHLDNATTSILNVTLAGYLFEAYS